MQINRFTNHAIGFLTALMMTAAAPHLGVAADKRPVPAFPGAEGFGASTPGGRGGKVFVVTTLEDYKPGGKETAIPGSLRAGVEADGPRIVVFAVAGLIDLKAPLVIAKPFITIAGQTAPGQGVCLKRYNGQITAHDVILRHLRFRPGELIGKQLDALSVYKAQNVILDHCSASWSVDEVLSVTGEGCTNVTVQWCLITESLNKSVHDKGEHGYGSLLRTDGDITFHHNLYAHHKTRCPRPGTYGQPRGILLDFRNNVIYDWGNPAGYTAEDKATLNYVGNYLKPGPSTTNAKAVFKVGGAATTMFVADNHLEGGARENADNWQMILRSEPRHRASTPLPVAAVTTDTAAIAYRRILEDAGASRPARDAVDGRVIDEVRTGRGRIIDTTDDVGGWPAYLPGSPPPDSDHDGMPDAWEEAYGLDKTRANAAGRDLDPNYDNIEVYVNGLCAAVKINSHR